MRTTTKVHRGFVIMRVDGLYQTEVRYQPRWIGAETSVGSVAAKRYREVCDELDALLAKGRIKEPMKVASGVPPHVLRDARLAAVKAMRGTEEWRARGEALAKRRAEELVERAKRESQRSIDDWEWAAFQVSDRRVDEALDEFEGMMMDASSDLGLPYDEMDAVAYDLMESYLMMNVLVGKPTKAKVALTIRLLSHLSMDVAEALDYVKRKTA